MTKKKMNWAEMSPGRKAVAIVVGVVQFVFAAAAWRDLATRSADQVNGPKGLWTAIIAVNWIGPAAYFLKGRKQ
jgi:hypothetical protein